MIATFLLTALVTTTGQPQAPSSDELRAAEERLASALIGKDERAFERLLAPDFVLRADPDLDRAAWTANALTLCWGDQYDIDDFQVVRASPDTAVVTLVLATNRHPTTCEPAIIRSLLTDVWRREGDDWMLALRHSGAAGADVDLQFARVALPPPLFEGSAELSLVATGGNSETETIGVGGSLVWRPAGWTTEARVSFVRSEAFDVATARSLVATVRQGRSLTAHLDAFGRMEYLVDEFAGIEHRVSIDAGLGYKAVDRPAHALRVDVGVGYSHEARLADRDLDAALANVASVYEWRFGRAAAVENTSLLTASLDRGRDWRVRNLLAITATVTRLFSLKLAHEVKYVNAPVAGFRRTDRTLSAALVAKF